MDTTYNSSPMTQKPDPVAHYPPSKTTSSLDDFEHAGANVHSAKLFESSSVLGFEENNIALLMDEEEIITGRDKLERHWREVARGGRVCIPEKWGQEKFLKDWMDYSLFDSLLAPKGVALAREALVAERRREKNNMRCFKMVDDHQIGDKVFSFLTS